MGGGVVPLPFLPFHSLCSLHACACFLLGSVSDSYATLEGLGLGRDAPPARAWPNATVINDLFWFSKTVGRISKVPMEEVNEAAGGVAGSGMGPGEIVGFERTAGGIVESPEVQWT